VAGAFEAEWVHPVAPVKVSYILHPEVGHTWEGDKSSNDGLVVAGLFSATEVMYQFLLEHL
jgi:hypothetical protein